MPHEVNMPPGALFAGEAKTLEFEILAAGQDPTNANATMQNVTGWALKWSLRKAVPGIAPHRQQGDEVLVKTTVTGITIVGTFNASRPLNTQRVRVLLAKADTTSLLGGQYVHGLLRTDVGAEGMLTFGTVALYVPAPR